MKVRECLRECRHEGPVKAVKVTTHPTREGQKASSRAPVKAIRPPGCECPPHDLITQVHIQGAPALLELFLAALPKHAIGLNALICNRGSPLLARQSGRAGLGGAWADTQPPKAKPWTQTVEQSRCGSRSLGNWS